MALPEDVLSKYGRAGKLLNHPRLVEGDLAYTLCSVLCTPYSVPIEANPTRSWPNAAGANRRCLLHRDSGDLQAVKVWSLANSAACTECFGNLTWLDVQALWVKGRMVLRTSLYSWAQQEPGRFRSTLAEWPAPIAAPCFGADGGETGTAGKVPRNGL
jgi:hypothetical protein